MGCALSSSVNKYVDEEPSDVIDGVEPKALSKGGAAVFAMESSSPPKKKAKVDTAVHEGNEVEFPELRDNANTAKDDLMVLDSPNSALEARGLALATADSTPLREGVDSTIYPDTLHPLRPENGATFDPKGAPLPSNEDFRIQVLKSYNLLDTAPEPRFDRLTALASMVFKTPVALVSLVDNDRQWFKSSVGLPACSQTDRASSFCAFTLLPSKDPCLIVPDATKDTRFVGNPLVTGEPYIRFYAGAPLITQGSYILGSLCIIDFVPRTFSNADKELLVSLAQLVVMEIEKHSKALEMQRLQAERFEEDKKGLLQAIDAFSEGLVLCDVVEKGQPIVFVNEGWEQITGYSIKEAMGAHCAALLQGPGTDMSAVRILRDACAEGREASVEIMNYRKDGTPFWNWLRIRPVLFPTGTTFTPADKGEVEQSRRYYFGIMSDCTVRKEKEIELENFRLKEIEAEAATRAKRQFVANISHEIRTPMNAIIACSQLLQDSRLTEDQRELAQMINGSGQQLLSLINDILDFSKLDAGKMDLTAREFNLWNCIDFCMEMLVLKCENKGLDLSFNMNHNVPSWVWADEVRLRQILTNLLSNAAKFTNEGGEIELSVSAKTNRRRTGSVVPRPAPLSASAATSTLTRVDSASISGPPSPSSEGGSTSAGGGWGGGAAPSRGSGWAEKIQQHPGAWLPQYELVFSVRDTGIGIPKDFQSVLFEAFTQCDNSRTRKYEGTGLGLAISKELAERMGGRMWVESDEGKGSTFYFSIIANGSPDETGGLAPPNAPLIPQNPPSPFSPNQLVKAPTSPVAGKRALLVGGRGTFQRMVGSMLKSWGVECEAATSAAEFRSRCTVRGSFGRGWLNDKGVSIEAIAAAVVRAEGEAPAGEGEGEERRRRSSFERPRLMSAERRLGKKRAYDLVVVDCPLACPGGLDESQVEGVMMQYEQAIELMQMGVALGEDMPTILLTAKHTKDQVVFDPKLLEKVTTLSRPVRVNPFYTAVVKLLSKGGATPVPCALPSGKPKPTAPAGADAPPDPLRIFIAEDNVINQRVLLKLLKGMGYDHVQTAMNGCQVLELLRNDAADLILMDVQMPEMDGMVATTRIRADFAEEKQPIIVALTADVGPGIEEECRQAGMGGYLSKPVRKNELEKVLNKCLEIKRSSHGRRPSLWLVGS